MDLILTPIKQYLATMTYTDYIEILLLSMIIYYISVWLSKDARHNLIGYLYGYCGLLALSHVAQLHTISFCLMVFAPVICVCFIIIHETTLQKNYITLRNTAPPEKKSHNWIEQLIRLCLHGMNDGISVTCLIEQNDQVRTLLKDIMHIQTDMHTGILDMLIRAQAFHQDRIIVINKWGTIVGINAQWSHMVDQAFAKNITADMDQYKQDALLYTAKTDALLFKTNPTTHTFDIIAHGTIFESVSAHAIIACLKKYITTTSSSNQGDIHEAFSQHKHQKQPRA